MIRSKLFWAGAILLALIPLIVLDIPKHYIDWVREVHDEMIETVYNSYHLNQAQKKQILDHILASNTNLMAMMYIKSFSSIILLFGGTYLLLRYKKQPRFDFWKASGTVILLLAATIAIKVFSWYSFAGDDKIKLLNTTIADTTLQNIYNTNFKGKVVYVDFWGTTCGPCLVEFRNFTKPLKARYKSRKDIAYLYISGGHEAVWRQQLKKYSIAGSHIFLGQNEYAKLYKRSVAGSKDTVITMPRYLIIDKTGKIAETNAQQPNKGNVLYAQLDKYLAFK
nr:TlpA family protein disulfide reductase [uncultured Mucilaginibacter sp.]